MKKLTVTLKKIIVSFFAIAFALAVIPLSQGNVKTANAEEKPAFNITEEMNDGVKTIRLNNINLIEKSGTSALKKAKAVDPLNEFAKEHPYGFDIEEARTSNCVVYQEEVVYASESEGSEEPDYSDRFDDGYLTIYTTAYHKGYTPTKNARYLVKGEVVFNKLFKTRLEERLILAHSANGTFDSTGTETGVMSYHASIHNHSAYVNPPIDEEKDVVKNLKPKYSSMNGVDFALRWPEDLKLNNNSGGPGKVDRREIYTDWHLYGSYYVIATNDMNVAVTYAHNLKIFAGSLGVSIGVSGANVNVTVTPENQTRKYSARPLTLYNI